MKHPIDLLGGLIVSRGPKRLRFFSEGWGDEDLLASFELPAGDPDPVAVDWGPVAFHRGKVVTRGSFPSPAMDMLPDRAHRARVISVEPPRTTERTVVLMAAWNEHDPRARLDIANLLADRGIASLILENPYYGERRPYDGDQQPIRTVSDFFQMGAGAVAEGRALLAMVRDQDRRPGVAGYSMGGNVTALVSALVPFAVATAPLAPSYSPAPVYLDGVLRGGIDWSALGGETRACPRLRTLLLRASVLEVPAPPHAHHAVLVAARRDAYVPSEATEALHHHWPGSELRWTPDGHATLLWFRKSTLATAIWDSFTRVDADSPNR
jgi:dienelactone hydrolase